MTTSAREAPSMRRAIFTMTATSFLVPAVGVITAPVLARGLGADGRGELASAMAPAALILGVATLGLPDALTYYLAKHPASTRRAVATTSAATLALGLVCLGASILTAPFFSGGRTPLISLIILASALTVPALVINVLRGAAAGRQLWGVIATERVVGSVIRIVALLALWLTGTLTVVTALVVLTVGPLLSAFPYVRLLRPVPASEAADQRVTLRVLMHYGGRVWLGSVASMLLSRSDQLLMVPLSSPRELGYYIVANTVSDVPIVVSLAIGSAVFGVSSRAGDATQITRTSRLVLLAALIGCLIIGGTTPAWIGALFGAAFRASTVPTILLLVASVVCVPSLIASSGIAAWGRPGLRSAGLLITFAFNLVALLVLVPLFGAIGAAVVAILSNLLMSAFMVSVAARLMGCRRRDFVAVGPAEVRRLAAEVQRLIGFRRMRNA